MSVRSSPSTENKGPVPFLGIPPSETWQIVGPAFPLGDCPLLPAPTIPRSLGWWPPSTTLAFVPPGPQLDSGSKVPAAGLSGRGWGGGAEVRPDPWVSSHSAGCAEETQAAQGHGLLRLGPLRGRGSATRETARVPVLQQLPRSLPQALASELPRSPSLGCVSAPGRAAAGRSAGLGCSASTADPGSGRRRLPAGAHGNAPPRAARPGRDSWVPKGLSRQSCGPSAPRAASPPRAGPSAHAPARYLRSRSRSSSTWPLSPGGRPSARPLGSAPRTLLATRPRPGEEGRGGDYHILAYQRASRGVSSQWSFWKGGDWSEHAQVLLRA